MKLRDIAIDIYPLSVELSISDFEFLIEAALSHEDEFFIHLLDKLEEIKLKHDKQTGES